MIDALEMAMIKEAARRELSEGDEERQQQATTEKAARMALGPVIEEEGQFVDERVEGGAQSPLPKQPVASAGAWSALPPHQEHRASSEEDAAAAPQQGLRDGGAWPSAPPPTRAERPPPRQQQRGGAWATHDASGSSDDEVHLPAPQLGAWSKPHTPSHSRKGSVGSEPKGSVSPSPSHSRKGSAVPANFIPSAPLPPAPSPPPPQDGQGVRV